MSEPKWTPGPWQFEPHAGFGGNDPDGQLWPFGYISAQGPTPIFELSPIIAIEPEELLADTRLIATAPDLYKYLEIALGVISGSGVVWMGADAARATLSRARGDG